MGYNLFSLCFLSLTLSALPQGSTFGTLSLDTLEITNNPLETQADLPPDRSEIFRKNREVSLKGYHIIDRTLRKKGPFLIPDTAKMIKKSYTVDFTKRSEPLKPNPHYICPPPTIENVDIIDSMLEQQRRGLRPLGFIQVDDQEPGEIARIGGNESPENTIHYRSNLFEVLNHLKKLQTDEGNLDHGHFLPQQGGALIPGLSIFREWIKGNWENSLAGSHYRYLHKIEHVDLYVSASYGANSLKTTREKQPWPELKSKKVYKERIGAKIEAYFIEAINNNYNTLNLIDFGCGEDAGNSPYFITEIYKELFLKYKGYFKEIHCSVLSRRGGESGEGSNFSLFKRALEDEDFQKTFNNTNPDGSLLGYISCHHRAFGRGALMATLSLLVGASYYFYKKQNSKKSLKKRFTLPFKNISPLKLLKDFFIESDTTRLSSLKS
jgi:hypothetical protein